MTLPNASVADGPGARTPQEAKQAAANMDALLDSIAGQASPAASPSTVTVPDATQSAIDLSNSEKAAQEAAGKKGLEKREADAREAQRHLSQERSKLQATSQKVEEQIGQAVDILEQFKPLLAAANALKASDISPIAMAVPDCLEEWKRDGATDLATVIEDIYAKLSLVLKRIEAVETGMRGQAEAVVDTVAGMHGQNVFTRLDRQFHQWRAVVAGDHQPFEDWLAKQPRVLRESYMKVLDGSVDYDFEDASAMLNAFASATGHSWEPPTPTTPDRRTPVTLDRVPLPEGGGSQAKGKAQAGALTPLSQSEMDSYSMLYARANPADRGILKQRYELTLDMRAGRTQ